MLYSMSAELQQHTLLLCAIIIVCVLVADRSTGRVGAPLTCNEVMLVDWKEGKPNQPMSKIVFFPFAFICFAKPLHM